MPEGDHGDFMDLISELRLPEYRLKDTSSSRRRDYRIADSLDLEFRPREASIIAPYLRRDTRSIS